MEVSHFISLFLVFILIKVNMADGKLSLKSKSKSGKMQRMSQEFDWSDLFDHQIDSLETHLLTESKNMLNGLFEETGTGSSGNEQVRNDMDDLITQLGDLRRNMDTLSKAQALLEKRMIASLRTRAENQQSTMNVEKMIRDLNKLTGKLADMSGAVTSLTERASDISLRNPEATNPVDCQAVRNCNDQYGDGEYFIYPRVLEGQKVKVYCRGMGGPDPKEYITLHNTNTATYNYSLRYDNDYCRFRDRDGDAVSTFHKIRIDVEDMSVQRYDFQFADIIVERPNHEEPTKFGAGGGCSWDYMYRNYRDCIAPGGFVVDTTGTGLVVDPELQWRTYGYGGRIEEVIRSNNNAHVTAACDGWCAWCFPVGEMILKLAPEVGLIGDATEPQCT
ncbi:uncharacterized protein LOC132563701 [Ylistrum balloti]|uniref:uncharacterized protein LOC132563701 n=1 Tax=Ylistrum balloti TaxID=509963 RepID=UPI002905860D|nr:uncharacterized protein LOC132563701 [Ylistrum balloti]